jgi:hypothetical protein
MTVMIPSCPIWSRAEIVLAPPPTTASAAAAARSGLRVQCFGCHGDQQSRAEHFEHIAPRRARL